MSTLTRARRAVDLGLVALVGLGLAAFLLGRLVPLSGHQTLVVGGSSMEPTIPLGAAVVTEVVPAAGLRVGDIVSLRTGSGAGTVFTHRITRLVERPDGTWLETKGDANPGADPTLTPVTGVIGRVVAEIPYAGYVLRFIGLPSGLAAVTCFIAFLSLSSWLLGSLEHDRRARAGRDIHDAEEMKRGAEALDRVFGAGHGRETGRADGSDRATGGRQRRRTGPLLHALTPRSAAAVQPPGH